MTTIHRLSVDDAQGARAWDAFVDTCPQATFFHKSGWQHVIRENFKHETYFYFAEVNGQVAGVLPLANVTSLLFGKSLVSLPFAVYGGVAANDESVAAALAEEAQRLARRLKVAHLEFRNIAQIGNDWPVQDLYVTFRKAIVGDDEANLQAIPRKQRAMVRKGIKAGLTSAIESDVDAFFALYADNVHRHGTPAFAKKYFQSLARRFGQDCDILLVRDAQHTPLSGVLSFYFRDEVLPYYAGDAVAARAVAANDFKYWELMRHAAARRVRVFDFGRSKRGTGSFDFKKNWGFEPTPLHYQYCLYQRDSIPQNNPSNKKFRLLIETWKKMPIQLANLIGPHIVRGLG
ncbi:MAG: FemAB family XrtA/PEP-CTERM system-associated protein [Burkholderiales bacterium]